MHILDLHPAEKRREAKEIFDAMFRGEKDSCPLPLSRKDGSLIPVDTRVWFGKWNEKDCIFGISKDLSRQEEALQKFNRLFSNNPAPMAVSSLPERKFTEVNDAFLSVLGYSRAEVIGKTAKDLGIFAQEEKAGEIADKLQSDGRVSNCELKVRKKDGTLLDGLFSGEIIDNQGQKNFLTVMLDISDRKRVEEMIWKSRSDLLAILDNLPFLAWLKDAEGRFIAVNKPFALSCNQPSPESVTGKTDFDVWPEHLAEGYCTDDREVIRERKKKNVEELVRDQGIDKWFETYKAPLFDEKGNVTGTTGFARDITDRKQAAEALQKAYGLLSSLLDSIPDIVFFKDLDGIYLGCNPEFARFAGQPREKIVGHTDHDLFSKEIADFFREQDLLMLTEKQPRHNEEWIDYPDGKRILIDTFKAPLRYQNNQIFGILGISRDITDRKKAETVLREAMALKSKFTSMASHELRSPLATMKGSVELMLDGLTGKISEEQKTVLSMLMNSIDRLVRLTDDILDFSKIEAGKMKFNFEKNDINVLAKEVFETMRDWTEQRKLSFSLHLDPNIPPVLFDKDKITQVIINLVNNALKFTELGGISIITERRDNVCKVTVKDTGPGIKKEDLENLFTPFQQLYQKTASGEKGTGLGLSICKEIVEGHRGKIWAESKVGSGSAFCFILPIIERRMSNGVTPVF